MPSELLEEWGPWVRDCVRMMDEGGAYRNLRYQGGLAEQPSVDMLVLDAVRSRWIELRNRDMEEKWRRE